MRQAGAECLLPDSGTQLHARPITYPGILKSTLQVELDSNMTEDGWSHTNFRKDEQFECFSRRVQFRDHFCFLVVSLSRGTRVIDLRAYSGTLFFLGKIQTITAKHSCTRKRVCAADSCRNSPHVQKDVPFCIVFFALFACVVSSMITSSVMSLLLCLLHNSTVRASISVPFS